MFGWNKNPNEKRAFVKKGTDEPAEKLVQGHEGEVIGLAATPSEEQHIVAEQAQEWKEAA